MKITILAALFLNASAVMTVDQCISNGVKFKDEEHWITSLKLNARYIVEEIKKISKYHNNREFTTLKRDNYILVYDIASDGQNNMIQTSHCHNTGSTNNLQKVLERANQFISEPLNNAQVSCYSKNGKWFLTFVGEGKFDFPSSFYNTLQERVKFYLAAIIYIQAKLRQNISFKKFNISNFFFQNNDVEKLIYIDFDFHSTQSHQSTLEEMIKKILDIEPELYGKSSIDDRYRAHEKPYYEGFVSSIRNSMKNISLQKIEEIKKHLGEMKEKLKTGNGDTRKSHSIDKQRYSGSESPISSRRNSKNSLGELSRGSSQESSEGSSGSQSPSLTRSRSRLTNRRFLDDAPISIISLSGFRKTPGRF